MLVLLITYAITQNGFGKAIPMPSIERRDPSSCGDHTETRTTWDIVWSCLSTIFLCTWVSLHANISSIPEKPDSGWFEKWLRNPLASFLKYKLPLFLWALLVPEYILAWAIRQYITAGRIQKQVPGWTRSHGFFLIMGGFQLFQLPDQPLQSMSGEADGTPLLSTVPPQRGEFVRILDVDDMYQHRLETIIPFTTEEEIKDRGKSDGISKSIVLLQTTWFVIQCIARGIKHLPLTELEIVTLAYAMMNFSIYIFWWDKPRDVGCPIRVYKALKTRHTPIEDYENGWAGLAERIGYYSLGMQDDYTQLSLERRVPMFWSGRIEEVDEVRMTALQAALGPAILGMAFGAIHFIAWSYEFPSYIELMLWRISCAAMVAVPLFCAFSCARAVTKMENRLIELLGTAAAILLILSAWLYIAARIATMVTAFTTLRSLPSDAFRVVDWTTFIPHI